MKVFGGTEKKKWVKKIPVTQKAIENNKSIFSTGKVGRVNQVREYSSASEAGTSQNNQFIAPPEKF